MAKDLEFAVENKAGREQIFKTFDAACGYAVGLAAMDGEEHHVDVLCWSRAAARAWGGEDGAEQYDDDPDASVHDRITVRAEHVGRVA